MKNWMIAAALGLSLAACSSEDQASDVPAAADASSVPASASPEPEISPAVVDPAILTLAGLGGLQIGKPPSAASGWRKDEAQISDQCITYGSNAQSNAYAMGDGTTIKRITVSADSGVKTEKGIGIGASGAEVRRAYPGIVAEPHKYVDAPGGYLTWIPQEEGPGIRFELDTDGKVNLIHAGVMPWLEYVEGCA